MAPAAPEERRLNLARALMPVAVLCFITGSTLAAEQTLEAAFLDSLIGVWEGRAVQTPIGPAPYDIAFARTDDGAVAGVADPGAALHHWRFVIVDGHLRLRFLSTFRGNERPIWLYAESLAPGAVRFRGRVLDHLAVGVEPGATELKLDIFLHGKPHVSIRLESARTLQ
jgi:hypothetical protein